MDGRRRKANSPAVKQMPRIASTRSTASTSETNDGVDIGGYLILMPSVAFRTQSIADED